MHALIIAHGEPVSHELLRSLATEADLVVAADGGYYHARDAGLTVDLVIGDFDSLSQSELDVLGPGKLHHDTNANTTDLEKAVAHVIAAGATAIDIACIHGGRPDHALANLSILVTHKTVPGIRIVDDQFEISLVRSESVVQGPVGTVISLVAIGQCTGVTTKGLRWDLKNHSLRFSAYGVHNEIASSPATVKVRIGDLLLFRGRWVEKHA